MSIVSARIYLNLFYEFRFCFDGFFIDCGTSRIFFTFLSRAIETKTLHEDGGLAIKYAPNAQQIVASIGRPNVTLIVTHLKSDKNELPLLMGSLKLFGGLCWHSRLPYVCCADDNKLSFWKIFVK